MIYRLGSGFDVVFGSLAPIAPQPRTKGMQFGNRMFGAANNIIDDQPFIEFMWNVSTVTKYRSILTQFNLISNNSSEVTVWIEDNRYTQVRKNGIAVLPQIGEDGERDDFFLRDFMITVHSLRNPA